MELETQNQVIANQLKRQAEETNQLREFLETKNANESKLERQVREAQRKYADLESRMKEDLMMARIRGDFKNQILFIYLKCTLLISTLIFFRVSITLLSIFSM